MKFNQGASVYRVDGKQVGHIDRVVINPKTKDVTDIVIRKGFLFTQDKVVPIDSITTDDDERLILQMNEEELNRLPDFEETHYVAVNEDELGHENANMPALYSYTPYGGSGGINPFVEPGYVSRIEKNIPEDTVALKVGARVIASDGKHVGEVDQVLTSSQPDRVTHFLISKGLVQKEVKLIPVEWIDTLNEDEVHLVVGSRTVQELSVFEHV